MAAQQLDLFAVDRSDVGPGSRCAKPPLRAVELADTALIAALPDAGLATAPSLAAEAAHRRLAGAVPALERLCRRLTGFGADSVVPEQAAALEALAAIGGEAARRTVARLLVERIVQGPTLAVALNAAAWLGASLPRPRLAELLRDARPSVRAGACRCVTSATAYLGVLTDLLDDLHSDVANAAVIALGRSGRVEARPALMALLLRKPAAELIEALVPIADEEVIVSLGASLERCPLSGSRYSTHSSRSTIRAPRRLASGFAPISPNRAAANRGEAPARAARGLALHRVGAFRGISRRDLLRASRR